MWNFAILEHQLAGIGATHAEFVHFVIGTKPGHVFFDQEAVAALLHQSATDPAFFPGPTATEPSA